MKALSVIKSWVIGDSTMKKTCLLMLSASLLMAALGACSGEKEETNDDSSSSQPASISSTPKDQSLPDFDKSAYSDCLIVHWKSSDSVDYASYATWLWLDGGDGSEYLPVGVDSYGAAWAVPLSTWGVEKGGDAKIGVIIKTKGSWSTQTSDMFFTLSENTPDANGNYEAWTFDWTGELYSSEPKTTASIKTAEFVSFSSLKYTLAYATGKTYSLYKDGSEIQTGTLEEKESGTIALEEKVELTSSYTLKISVSADGEDTVLEKNVSFAGLYDSDEFVSSYVPSEDVTLGASVADGKTTFNVWSPFSSKVTLNVYDSGTPTSVSKEKGDDTVSHYEMSLGENGVYTYTVDESLYDKYYTYTVTNGSYKETEIVDPYAYGAGVNGVRGLIVDFSKTNPDGWDETSSPIIDRKAMTVYETHVVDVTSSSTWGGTPSNAKKYLGLSEEGTIYESAGQSVKTGFDHIKELGVNAVQLMPIYDQANDEVDTDFNWGYNPLNYNVLEGSYSSDPYDGYVRIKEFKEVVKAYYDAGIDIIMDVVYNHVNSVKNGNFDVLAPDYYFRLKDDGSYWSGSGCGNDTASERDMMARYIKDSASFWASEYKLSGFRFDLMGLIATECMNDTLDALKAINPNIVVYGEAWQLSTGLSNNYLAQYGNIDKFNDYGLFNDQIRDSLIAGGLSGDDEYGFAFAKYDRPKSTMTSGIKYGLSGIYGKATTIISYPDKVVNYASCHDNYTLYDRCVAWNAKHAETDAKPDLTEEEIEHVSALANSVVYTSQGTSFMLAGEEMLRSKYAGTDDSLSESARLSIAKNSYDDTYETNTIDYSLKLEHPTLFADYQKMIALKQSASGLHLEASEAAKLASSIEVAKSYNQIVHEFSDETTGRTYKVAHCSGYENTSNPIPDVDFSGYTLYLDTLHGETTLSEATAMKPFQTIIAYKESE